LAPSSRCSTWTVRLGNSRSRLRSHRGQHSMKD
jgi:hypothetical protein